jgi:hypothetical protein
MYARKLMNRLLLQLAAMKEISQALDLDPKVNRNAAGQRLVVDETQRLLSKFLEAEKAASEYRHTSVDDALHLRFASLVKELLTGFQNMGTEHLKDMSWLNPVLLGSCIQSKNEEIRFAVQKLVQSTTPGSTTPYPAPSPKNEQMLSKDVPTTDTSDCVPPSDSPPVNGKPNVAMAESIDEVDGDAPVDESKSEDEPVEIIEQYDPSPSEPPQNPKTTMIAPSN